MFAVMRVAHSLGLVTALITLSLSHTIEARPGRYPLAHVKDMGRTDTSMVDVGDGRIDFRALFAALRRDDFRHLIVEHDNSADPFRTLERSLVYLRPLTPHKGDHR
jgi:sugar phosphate isomerase/epimerase